MRRFELPVRLQELDQLAVVRELIATLGELPEAPQLRARTRPNCAASSAALGSSMSRSP